MHFHVARLGEVDFEDDVVEVLLPGLGWMLVACTDSLDEDVVEVGVVFLLLELFHDDPRRDFLEFAFLGELGEFLVVYEILGLH